MKDLNSLNYKILMYIIKNQHKLEEICFNFYYDLYQKQYRNLE